MTMKLYIFRHGQTYANAANIVQGGYEDEAQLNENGLRQAAELRDQLAAENIPVVYASPFDRARKTGETVAEANHSKVVILDELREFDFGEAEHQSEAEVLKKYGYEFSAVLNAADETTYDVRIPGGESKREALARFKQVLDFVRQDCQCDKAGIATHGHIMRLFFYDKYKKDHLFGNCEYFVIDV